MQIILGVIIKAALFAVLFPLFMRLFTGKWIGWFSTLIAVFVFAVVGTLLQYGGLVDRILVQVAGGSA